MVRPSQRPATPCAVAKLVARSDSATSEHRTRRGETKVIGLPSAKNQPGEFDASFVLPDTIVVHTGDVQGGPVAEPETPPRQCKRQRTRSPGRDDTLSADLTGCLRHRTGSTA